MAVIKELGVHYGFGFEAKFGELFFVALTHVVACLVMHSSELEVVQRCYNQYAAQ